MTTSAFCRRRTKSQCSFQHLHQRCHCVFQLGKDSSYSGLCLCFLHSYAQCIGKVQWQRTLLSYRSIWCKVLIPDMLLVNISSLFFTFIAGLRHHFLCEGFSVFDRCLPICWCKGVGRGWVPNGSQHNGRVELTCMILWLGVEGIASSWKTGYGTTC